VGKGRGTEEAWVNGSATEGRGMSGGGRGAGRSGNQPTQLITNPSLIAVGVRGTNQEDSSKTNAPPKLIRASANLAYDTRNGKGSEGGEGSGNREKGKRTFPCERTPLPEEKRKSPEQPKQKKPAGRKRKAKNN